MSLAALAKASRDVTVSMSFDQVGISLFLEVQPFTLAAAAIVVFSVGWQATQLTHEFIEGKVSCRRRKRFASEGTQTEPMAVPPVAPPVVEQQQQQRPPIPAPVLVKPLRAEGFFVTPYGKRFQSSPTCPSVAYIYRRLTACLNCAHER